MQILLGKFAKDLKLSLRNNEAHNPLDLAVTNKNNAIVKLLMKHTKPELSSLLCAVDTYQSDLVQLFGEQLKKPLEKRADLLLPMQRFIELSEEIMLKTTSEERRIECKVI